MDKWFYRALIALCILGLLVSIYMTIYKLFPNNEMCVGSGGCEIVNASKYSEVNGFPVAAIGIIGYAAMLATLYFEDKNPFLRENGSMLFFGMALTGFIFTLWLVYVELAILGEICPFCLTSQIAMTCIFILAIIRLFRNPDESEES